MMYNTAASPAADAWHPGPQCAGDGGGGKTENSASEQQIQAHRSFNARPAKHLPRYATATNMRTLLALAVIATVMGSGKVAGEACPVLPVGSFTISVSAISVHISITPLYHE